MIWGQVIATGLAAGLAGALAVPAARRMMLGDIKHDWLQDELELDCIEPDGVTVRGKDGGLTRIWRLRGTSYDAKVEQEQHTLLLGRSALLHQLGRRLLTVRLFALKRKRAIHYDASWPSRTLEEIGEAEAKLFRSSYYVDWFVMVTGSNMQALLEADEQIAAMAGDYAPELLARAEKPGEPCPLTGFLNGLVSGEFREDLPVVSSHLSGALPGSDMLCEKASGLITTHVPGKKLHKILGVSSWPETVSGRLVGEILALPGDIEICQICEPYDRDKAMLVYTRRRVAESGALFGNPAAANECNVNLALLAEGNTTLFATQFQIIVRAEDEIELNQLIKGIGDILGNRRVLYHLHTKGAPVCWFNRLPTLAKGGKLLPGGRFMTPLDLREENIAALWAFPHSARGMLTSPYGAAPVRWFRSPTGQAYAFQFHVADKPQARGSYLVFAGTGGGKSTLMMHLLGGLAKFPGVRSYIFDSKEGTRFMVEAMGGVYQSYDTLALNPLDVGEDTPVNRNRIYAILRAMAGGLQLEAEDKEALLHAVELAFHTDPPQRTLSAIFPFAFPKRSKLRQEFAKWVVDDKGYRGLHAHVFNAPHDSLGGLLDHFMVAINMNEALDDPELGPPVVAHIAAAIGKSAASSAKGFNIFIDEAAKLLQNKGFRDLAAEMFREYRKLNGSVGLAFQDPAALMKSGMAEAFIENASTFIFLPNAQASADSFAPFNLNDEQMNFVLGRAARKDQRRALIVKRDAASGADESAIIDVDLSPLGDALRFYRSGVDANKHLAELQKTWGPKWQEHL
ncbi:VirB4 family type IV secretion system protein [Telmatospirillum sp. J64-1]|uniref:VirB4 family type IV secretion system protein n=1 Tax=Telmatospirillum sp. J64-1 TaxID=2502183 RepID=UPI00115F05B1|nr:VirB4 family type IV secretion system protein [Telmatospirillum sp. J64-1]